MLQDFYILKYFLFAVFKWQIRILLVTIGIIFKAAKNGFIATSNENTLIN